MKQLIYQPIEAMSIINPTLCRNLTIQVEVEQRDAGKIPHLHVYHDKTRNPKKCSYVRLDKAEYSPHHDIIPLGNLKDQFIKVMTSLRQKHVYMNNNGQTRIATGYEVAVDTWVETFENDDYSKFNLDKEGNLVMPDYYKL